MLSKCATYFRVWRLPTHLHKVLVFGIYENSLFTSSKQITTSVSIHNILIPMVLIFSCANMIHGSLRAHTNESPRYFERIAYKHTFWFFSNFWSRNGRNYFKVQSHVGESGEWWKRKESKREEEMGKMRRKTREKIYRLRRREGDEIKLSIWEEEKFELG